MLRLYLRLGAGQMADKFRVKRGTLDVDEETVVVSVAGMSMATCQIVSTVNFQGVVVFEISNDGTNWKLIPACRLDTSNPLGPIQKFWGHFSNASASAINAWFWVPSFGALELRCRVQDYTIGSLSCALVASTASLDYAMLTA